MSVCTPLVSISLVVKLFPGTHRVSVYRWNRAEGGRGRRLPDADVVIDGEKFWTLQTIELWAKDEGLQWDDGVAAEIVRTQVKAGSYLSDPSD